MRNIGNFLRCFAAFIFITQISALLPCASALGSPVEPSSNTADWSSIDSNFFVIYYNPAANLRRIERELKKRPLYFDQTARYGEVTTSQEICYRLDTLFGLVKEVLNMYPKIPKVQIKIFRDRIELNKEYFKLFGKKEDFRSFYIYEYNTIYTSEVDITDSIIIHEMAHAVIDHYFSVIPPKIISEVLASYVDVYFGE